MPTIRTIRAYRTRSSDILRQYVESGLQTPVLVVPLSDQAEPFAVANYVSLTGMGAKPRIAQINIANGDSKINQTAGVYPTDKDLKSGTTYKAVCVDHIKRNDVIAMLIQAAHSLKEDGRLVSMLYIAVRDLYNTSIDGD